MTKIFIKIIAACHVSTSTLISYMTLRTKKRIALKLFLWFTSTAIHIFSTATSQTLEDIFSPLSFSAQSLRRTVLWENVVKTQVALVWVFFTVETIEFVIVFQKIICIILENTFKDNT